jgi:hypothetical protein
VGKATWQRRPWQRRPWRALAATVFVSSLLAAVTARAAAAQITECQPRPYHHVGCDDGSGPDVGKWAWNPGEPSNWPGLGVVGNVHWWVQFGWHDPRRHASVRARDGDLPSLEFSFYDARRRCGCDVDVLKVRLRHHVAPPQPGQVLFTVLRGDCANHNASVLRATFTRTRQLFHQANYDLSVDARARFDRETGGEAHLRWEADGTAMPRDGCAGNPRARVWLGGLRHCLDLRLKSSDPVGICCSTSYPHPLCPWTPCSS